MSLSSYLWRVYCTTEGVFETVISDTEPTVCPSDNGPIDPVKTVILETRFIDISTDSYVNIQSTLSDNQAIKINASDPNGGINIDAGFGGITVDTTNTISLDATAASNFTTTNGNLTLSAMAGLVNIDGGSGINLGNDSATTPILVGSTSFVKNITVGNMTGTSTTDIRAGSGGFNADANGPISLDANNAPSNFTLSTNADAQDLTIAVAGNTNSSLIMQSSGTGSDALALYTTQGNMQMTALGASNNISLATAFGGSGSISISSGAGGLGSLVFESGSAGIAMNAYNGGAIGIGHFSGGDMFIGNAAVARTITFGNSTGATRIFERWGTGGHIDHMGAETTLSDIDATLTTTQLLTGILTIGPTANRTLTLPTAASIVSDVSGIQVDDCIRFTIIHTSTGASDPFVSLAMGTGGSSVGLMNIYPYANNAGTYYASGSANFCLRMTNVTPSSEAYKIYRK